MVVWSWWIGLADDECIAARVESCQEGLAGCQPSVPAQVDLISHRQACQLAFAAVRGWGAQHGALRAPPAWGWPRPRARWEPLRPRGARWWALSVPLPGRAGGKLWATTPAMRWAHLSVT